MTGGTSFTEASYVKKIIPALLAPAVFAAGGFAGISNEMGALKKDLGEAFLKAAPRNGPAKIAVLYFEELSPDARKSRAGQVVCDAFTRQLAGDPAYRVVEKEKLDAVFKEFQFSPAAGADQQDFKRAWVKLGIDHLALGGISDSGGNFLISARFVSVETGGTAAAASVTMEKSRLLKEAGEFYSGKRNTGLSAFLGGVKMPDLKLTGDRIGAGLRGLFTRPQDISPEPGKLTSGGGLPKSQAADTVPGAGAKAKADVPQQPVRAAAAGEAAAGNSGSSEKNMPLNRPGTAGEQAVFASRDSPLLTSLQPGGPDKSASGPVFSSTPDTDAAPAAPAPSPVNPKDELISGMIESDHVLSERERSILMKTLNQYRLEALRRLYDSGFRIVVMQDYKEFPTHWYGDTSEYYQPPKIYTRKDYLDGGLSDLWPPVRTALKDLASIVWYREVPWGGVRETIMHEMGHAWDDNLVKGGEGSDPRVRELYKNYLASKNQWSSYAVSKNSTAEYLAEGYRMCGQSAESRKILEKKDPGLYGWLKPRAAALYEN